MTERYLGFDFGAGSGRAVIGDLDDEDRLVLTELHRFPNEAVKNGGVLRWDVEALYGNLLKGMGRCAEQGRPVAGLGIDAWGVDFGMIDGDGHLLAGPRCYRDSGFEGAMGAFFKILPPERIFERTGLQFLPFNTLFQLHAMMLEKSPLLDVADSILLMADLFTHFLTGITGAEITAASTTQLFNPRTGDWDETVLKALGLPGRLLPALRPTASVVGPLLPAIAQETGLSVPAVLAVAAHDTASAVAAVPADRPGFAYISSGTWSLVGFEASAPVMTEEARHMNFTNEAGAGGRTRVLKNVMGLWLLERCLDGTGRDYEAILAAAEQREPFQTLIDPDDRRFLNPPDMAAAIDEYARETGQPVPVDLPARVRAVLEGLGLAYRAVLEQADRLAPRPLDRIHVIGGGSRNRLLNRFTAEATGRPVHAGPVEATAMGNLLTAAMATGRVDDLDHLRRIATGSTSLETFEPDGSAGWDRAFDRFRELGI